MGATVNLNLGAKGLQFLRSPVGKGVFETVAQIMVNGDAKRVDISDVAVSVFIKNKSARDVLKTFVDITAKDGFELNSLNEGLFEFGLRVLVDKTTPGGNKTGQNYVIEIIKKKERQERKEAIRNE